MFRSVQASGLVALCPWTTPVEEGWVKIRSL